MEKKIKYLLILFLSIFVFFIFFKGLNKPSVYIPDKILNKEIINFTGKDLFSDNKINFKDLLIDKKYTVLNIWASWCMPCRSEHKYLINLSSNSNLKLIGLNYKDQSVKAKKFILEFGNPYSYIIVDQDGTKSIDLGAYGVPETFIINNERKKIIKKYIGPLDQIKFNEIIKITQK